MILITGATGFIGRHVTLRLMEEEQPIRCFLPKHRLTKIPWDEDDQRAPEVVIGDILDEDIMFKAMTGAHTVIHLENAMWWGRERELERIEVAGTRNVIAVARATRVGRIITLSQLGAAPSSAFSLHRIKGQVEDLVRASGLAYTIIRSGIVFGEDDAFMNNILMLLALNPFFFLMPGRGEVALHPIYIDDLVAIIIKSLNTIDVVDRVIEVGGAEYTTVQDMIHTLMRVSGIGRPTLSIPPYLMRLLARFYGLVLPRSLITSQWMDILATHRTAKLGTAYEYFGIHPKRFEDTLVTYVPGRGYFGAGLRFILRRRPRGI